MKNRIIEAVAISLLCTLGTKIIEKMFEKNEKSDNDTDV